jgi:hypothetical protein
MASTLSIAPASISWKQYAHSTVEGSSVRKRKHRRAKRKWRSSGDNTSSSSRSEKLDQIEDDVKEKTTPTRQKNCTYKSTDFEHGDSGNVDSREYLSEKVCTKQKRSHSKENMRYKSTSQVETCSHIVIRKIRKAPSVFELDTLSGSPERITSTLFHTEEIMPHMKNGDIDSDQPIKKEGESDNVSRELFLDADLIIGQGSRPSLYFTTPENFNDYPLVTSSSKQPSSDDFSRSKSDNI